MKLFMSNQIDIEFVEQVQELHLFVQGALTLLERASDERINFSRQIICLLEEGYEILEDGIFAPDKQQVIQETSNFCKAILALLRKHSTNELSWLSTVHPLMVNLDNFISQSISVNTNT